MEDNLSNVQLDENHVNGGLAITSVVDYSNRGNNFYNFTGSRVSILGEGQAIPGNVHFPFTYVTSKNLLGIHRTESHDFFGSVFYTSNSLAATDEFYLGVFFGNMREEGNREIWGAPTDPNNRMVLLAAPNYREITMTINGVSKDIAGNIPFGPMYLEVWRDANNVMHVRADGVELGYGETMNGTFDMTGFGYNGDGHSYFDDELMEIVVADGQTSSMDREQLLQYMNNKWKPSGSFIPDF